MSYGPMKQLWYLVFGGLDTGFGEPRRNVSREVVSGPDGKDIQNSCFGEVFPMTEKALVTFGNQRRLKNEKSPKDNLTR